MGLIRKSLRVGSFLAFPIAPEAMRPKGESKKQRYLRQIAEGTGGKPAPKFGQSGFRSSRDRKASGPTAARPAATSLGVSSELERLASLHEKGHLTDEEFAAAKSKLLGL